MNTPPDSPRPRAGAVGIVALVLAVGLAIGLRYFDAAPSKVARQTAQHAPPTCSGTDDGLVLL